MPKPDFGQKLQFLPQIGGPCQNIAMFGMEKLDWCGYLTVKKKLKICLFISTEYTNVTDTQTDRQTPHEGIGWAYA